MPEEIETLTIDKCPKCSLKHEYQIKVRRTLITSMLDFADRTRSGHPVTFTRLFTCPETGDDFQARLVLYQEGNSQIDSVEIRSLTENDDT
jgi:hypothetical protein